MFAVFVVRVCMFKYKQEGGWEEERKKNLTKIKETRDFPRAIAFLDFVPVVLFFSCVQPES